MGGNQTLNSESGIIGGMGTGCEKLGKLSSFCFMWEKGGGGELIEGYLKMITSSNQQENDFYSSILDG